MSARAGSVHILACLRVSPPFLKEETEAPRFDWLVQGFKSESFGQRQIFLGFFPILDHDSFLRCSDFRRLKPNSWICGKPGVENKKRMSLILKCLKAVHGAGSWDAGSCHLRAPLARGDQVGGSRTPGLGAPTLMEGWLLALHHVTFMDRSDSLCLLSFAL